MGPRRGIIERVTRFECSGYAGLWLVLGVSALAIAVRAATHPYLHEIGTYIAVFPAVVIATMWCGWVAGAAALALTVACSAYFFADGSWGFPKSTEALLEAILSTAIGVLMIVISETQRRTRLRHAKAEADAHRLTDQVREAEERYRSLVEQSPDGVAVYVDGKIVYSNHAAVEIARARNVEEMLGRDVMEFAHPDSYEALAERQRLLRERGACVPVAEQKFVALDGTVVEAEVASGPVWWHGKRAVMTTMRDLRERKRAEASLRESEERFRLLAEAVPDIIYTCRPDGPCDYVNSRFTDLTGLSQEQSLGYGWMMALHPDDVELARREWIAARNSATEYEFRYRFRKADGEFMWFMGRARPILGKDGRPVRWFGTITDVHQMIAAQMELEQQARKLVESNTDLEDYAATVAHDLKEPLRGISNFARMLRDDYGARIGPEGAARFETLMRLPERLEELLDSLLEFSSAERGGLTIEPTDLGMLARRAINDLRQKIEEERAEVTVQEQMPVAPCDPKRIEQVLQNLIVNGLKYNTSGQKRIEIGAREGVVYVRDNGIGIDPRHHKSVFNMFRRLHGREAFGGGSGAGLAIVRKIVERHGGTVWLESEPGKGTTFHFTLGPRTPAPGAQIEVKRRTGAGAAPAGG